MSGEYTHISVGNINIDIVLYVDRLPGRDEDTLAESLDIRPGGAASNYAVAVSQYGHRVHLVAVASSHVLAGMALRFLEEKGVSTRYVRVVDKPPGMVLILVLPSGERSMIRYPGANTGLESSLVLSSPLSEAHVVHFATVHPRIVEESSQVARKYPVIVTYDPGRYAPEVVNTRVLDYVDILFVNEGEYAKIKETIGIERVFKHGVSLLVVKRGARGAMAITASGICYTGFAQPVKKPVDSTGAGDAFDAFFNARYIESKSIAEALRYATAAGTLKTGYRGSMLVLDKKLFEMQLEKTIVEKKAECEV